MCRIRWSAFLSIFLFLACSPKPVEPPVPTVESTPVAEKTAEAPQVAEEAIATLASTQAEVFLKPARELKWDPAQEGQGLKNYDSIKTGKASGGVIRYSDQHEVKMGENTFLIVLDRSKKERVQKAVLALPRGTIDSQVSAETGETIEMVIKTQRGWIKASNRTPEGKPVRIQFSATVSQKGEVAVRNDSEVPVQLATEGKEVSVEQQRTLVVAAPPGGVQDLTEVSTSEIEKSFEAPPQALLPSELKVTVTAPPKNKGTAQAAEKASPSAPAVVGDVFKVSSPKNKSSVTSEEIKVEGILTGKMSAILNGKPVQADSQGKFSVVVPLVLGTNLITFQVMGPKKSEIRYETIEVTRR